MISLELQHWSHDHLLVLSEQYGDNFGCDLCSEGVYGLSYCCVECYYALHKWCSELPREFIGHQLHPEHTLILSPLEDWENTICKACETKIASSFIFFCKKCSYALHVGCASLPREIKFKFCGSDSLPTYENLMLTRQFATFDKCTVCNQSLSESFFASEDGKDMYHKKKFHIHCAMLPKTVKHEKHLHDLTLHVPIEKDLDYDECYCDVCEKDRDPNAWVYYCEKCELAAHLSCGSSGLVRPNQRLRKKRSSKQDQMRHLEQEKEQPIVNFMKELEKEKERRKERTSGDGKGLGEIAHFCHKHPLTLDDEHWNGAFKCNACTICIFGKTYSCKECSFYLHKWCAELPQEIHLDAHHKHPLTLLPKHDVKCTFCETKNFGFSFSCEECDFGLHTTCAFLSENPKHESHEHPLHIMIYTPNDFPPVSTGKFPVRTRHIPPCIACQFPCEGLSLECDKCGFYLHVGCALLPPTGKAETHRHSLVLNFSYQEDQNAEEFFCDACEKPRIPTCWVYCCPHPNCYIVSHIDCAVANLLPSPLTGFISMGQEET